MKKYYLKLGKKKINITKMINTPNEVVGINHEGELYFELLENSIHEVLSKMSIYVKGDGFGNYPIVSGAKIIQNGTSIFRINSQLWELTKSEE